MTAAGARVRFDSGVRREDNGWARCLHDMYEGTCAICKALPDVPVLDLSPDHFDDRMERSPAARVYPAERSGRCVLCDQVYRVEQRVMWDAEHDGTVGPCCLGRAA